MDVHLIAIGFFEFYDSLKILSFGGFQSLVGSGSRDVKGLKLRSLFFFYSLNIPSFGISNFSGIRFKGCQWFKITGMESNFKGVLMMWSECRWHHWT